MSEIMEGAMKKHLTLLTSQDGVFISKEPISDPFHTTRVFVEVKFGLWDCLKMLWHRTYKTCIVVRVCGDDVAHRYWFATGDGRKSIAKLEEEAEIDRQQQRMCYEHNECNTRGTL